MLKCINRPSLSGSTPDWPHFGHSLLGCWSWGRRVLQVQCLCWRQEPQFLFCKGCVERLLDRACWTLWRAQVVLISMHFYVSCLIDLASGQSFPSSYKGLTLSKPVAFLSPLVMPPETLEGFSLLCLNKALFISTLLVDTSVHIVGLRFSSVQKMLIESFGPALPQKRKGDTKAGAEEKSCVPCHSIQNHYD